MIKKGSILTKFNYCLLLALALLSEGASQAQTIYESPHVSGGKTFQLTVPAGYFEVANTGTLGFSAYATKQGLDGQTGKLKELDIGVLLLIHLPVAEHTYSSLFSSLTDKLFIEREGVVQYKTERMSVDQFDFAVAGVEGKLDGDEHRCFYIGILLFGDYFVSIMYSSVKDASDFLSFEGFKEVMKTLKEVETDKKDGMQALYPEQVFSQPNGVEGRMVGPPPPPPAPVASDSFFKKILSEHYKNDLFETKLSPLDFFPDLGVYWSVPMEGNTHLLLEFVFKRNEGSIKIFSGGPASNYSSETEIADALQLVLNPPEEFELQLDFPLANENVRFNNYDVEGGGTMCTVYTAEVRGELVFFVAYNEEIAKDDFTAEVHKFLLSMLVINAEEDVPIQKE